MDVRKHVRNLGWLSLGSGIAMLTAPRLMARTYGLPERALLIRALGARDVAIGAGIVTGRTKWIRLRAAADVMDLMLMALKIATGPRRPVGRLLAGVGATLAVFELARRVQQD